MFFGALLRARITRTKFEISSFYFGTATELPKLHIVKAAFPRPVAGDTAAPAHSSMGRRI
jgi:hypothetical protein